MHEWITLLQGWFASFIDYFQAQSLPVQVVLGVTIVLGFVGLGCLLYAVFWLTFQILKATVVGIVLLAYLSGALVGFFFLLFIDAERIPDAWKDVKHNMAWWIERAYPPRHREHVPVVDQRVSTWPVEAHKSPRVVIETRGLPAPRARVQSSGDTFFCTACGTPFSGAMAGLLAGKHACFCETCGQKFLGKTQDPVVA